MSEANKDTDQILLSVAIISGAIIAIFLIGFMLPAIVFGFFLGEVFLLSAYKNGVYKLDLKVLKRFGLGLAIYFLLFGFPLEFLILKFRGLVFIFGDEYIARGLSELLQFMERHLPKRLTPKSFSGLGLRKYLWAIWPVAGLFFYFKLKKSIPPLFRFITRIKLPKFKYSNFQIGNFSFEISKKANVAKVKDTIHLGTFKDKLVNSDFEVSEACLRHHMQILGASGFGKSMFIFRIIQDRILKNRGLLFVDLKTDIANVQSIIDYAHAAGRLDKLKLFSCAGPEFSSYYNILSRGTATELKDRIMSSLEWSDVFYQNQCGSTLLKIMVALVWVRDNTDFKPHLGTLMNCLNHPDSLAELKQKVKPTEIKIIDCLEQVDQYLRDKEKYNYLQGLRTPLEEILLSEYGHKLCPSNQDIASGQCIDIYKAVQNTEIIYFLLDSRRMPVSAKALGRMILADLKAASAEIDDKIAPKKRQAFNIIIDEFADMASEEFISFLDRARSSGMGTIVAHQEISDLKHISPETADRLMHLTSTTVAFLLKLPESAEKISAIAGTKTSLKTTEKAQTFFGITFKSGDVSLREVEEFILHPNVIKKLKVGEAVVVGKYPSAYSGVIKTPPPIELKLSEPEFREILKQMAVRINQHAVAAAAAMATVSTTTTKIQDETPIVLKEPITVQNSEVAKATETAVSVAHTKSAPTSRIADATW
jgi:hypothetical protein